MVKGYVIIILKYKVLLISAYISSILKRQYAYKQGIIRFIQRSIFVRLVLQFITILLTYRKHIAICSKDFDVLNERDVMI